MKYGLSLDQKKATKLFITENGNPMGLPFSPQGARITLWWVSQIAQIVLCHAQGRVRWLLRGFVCLWNALRGKADC